MKNQTTNIYKQATRFANLTKTFIVEGNIQRVKKCFAVAEIFFENGSAETKNAISNVYVFSISRVIEAISPTQKQVNDILPQALKNIYLKQIMASYP